MRLLSGLYRLTDQECNRLRSGISGGLFTHVGTHLCPPPEPDRVQEVKLKDYSVCAAHTSRHSCRTDSMIDLMIMYSVGTGASMHKERRSFGVHGPPPLNILGLLTECVATYSNQTLRLAYQFNHRVAEILTTILVHLPAVAPNSFSSDVSHSLVAGHRISWTASLCRCRYPCHEV